MTPIVGGTIIEHKPPITQKELLKKVHIKKRKCERLLNAFSLNQCQKKILYRLICC